MCIYLYISNYKEKILKLKIKFTKTNLKLKILAIGFFQFKGGYYVLLVKTFTSLTIHTLKI